MFCSQRAKHFLHKCDELVLLPSFIPAALNPFIAVGKERRRRRDSSLSLACPEKKTLAVGERARKHGILKEKRRQIVFGSFHPTPTTFTKNQIHPTRHSFTNWVLMHAASTLFSRRTVSGLFTAFLNCSTCNLIHTVVGFLTCLLQKKEFQAACSLTEIAHSYK